MEQKIKINCVIGIDPGAGGGIAVFVPGHNTKALKMPKTVPRRPSSGEMLAMFSIVVMPFCNGEKASAISVRMLSIMMW